MTIAFSIFSVFLVLTCHCLGLFTIRQLFESLLRRLDRFGALGDESAFMVTILLLVMLNFLDVAICATMVWIRSPGLDYSAAFVFSIANYTTVGAVTPPTYEGLRVAGPLIAMCGIFIFGWTTSFLVACSRASHEAAVARRERTEQRADTSPKRRVAITKR